MLAYLRSHRVDAIVDHWTEQQEPRFSIFKFSNNLIDCRQFKISIIFYFKNNRLGIDYIGVDGSVDHLKDFIDNLNGGGDDVKLIHSVILGNKSVVEFPSMFNDMKYRMVMSMTFGDLVRLIGKKVDFMKFDIEGYESHIFSDNLDVFKKHIRKFSGEFHFNNIAYGVVSRQVSMDILTNLKNDKDIDLRLFSLDGVDITEHFWNVSNYYNEIIISGYVKQ